jgi:hypothetical protein
MIGHAPQKDREIIMSAITTQDVETTEAPGGIEKSC